MKKIGITGGIGSGKTIVSKVFHRLSIPVYNADDRAKQIVAGNNEAAKKIKEVFGKDVYSDKGELDRQKLASIVFNDREALNELNAIVHPLVGRDFEQWCDEKEGTFPYIIKEAAILYESGTDKGLDEVVVVTAPEKLRIKRVRERDGVGEKEVRARMKNQMPQKEKEKLADYVVYNDDKHAVIPQVLKLHRLFSA